VGAAVGFFVVGASVGAFVGAHVVCGSQILSSIPGVFDDQHLPLSSCL
jgi:hypothetical protein